MVVGLKIIVFSVGMFTYAAGTRVLENQYLLLWGYSTAPSCPCGHNTWQAVKAWFKFCKSHIPIVALNLHNERTHTHEITWQPIWIGTCRDAEQGLQGFTTAKGPSWEYGAKDQDRGREDESRLDNENSNYILFQRFKNWHLFNWLILDSPIWCLIVNSSILNCAKLYSSWMGYRQSVSFLVFVISFSNCIFNIIVNGSHHDSGSHDQSWPGGM